VIWRSPVGYLEIETAGDALTRIHFTKSVDLLPARREKVAEGRMRGVMQQLEEYFAGKRKSFDIPLSPKGTAFQLEVWRALQEIPYGETRSYAEIAKVIGRPDAVRAVGAANGANPIPIIIPCHRVIGSNGSLTGFGGGIDVKRALLNLEAGLQTLYSLAPPRA
jgi:methylated-DNA-[protein]-cysteine S-methyltransferase